MVPLFWSTEPVEFTVTVHAAVTLLVVRLPCVLAVTVALPGATATTVAVSPLPVTLTMFSSEDIHVTESSFTVGVADTAISLLSPVKSATDVGFIVSVFIGVFILSEGERIETVFGTYSNLSDVSDEVTKPVRVVVPVSTVGVIVKLFLV